MHEAVSIGSVVDDILAALINQKDALIALSNQAEGYDKALTDQLIAVVRALEKLIEMSGQFRRLEEQVVEASHAQMTAFLNEVDDRIAIRVKEKFNEMVDRAALAMCDGCAAALRSAEAPSSSGAT